MFRPRKPLIRESLDDKEKVPEGPGVYIIYRAGQPFYVGRSLVNIRERLWRHATKQGSKKVREALSRGETLTFEWEELLSPHQAESQLITQLGTRVCGNLRRETDPADW